MSAKKAVKVASKQKKIITEQQPETEVVATIAPVTVKSKAKRLQQVKEREHGIIYIGHLPYGFLEEGLKDYFTQFGQVLGSKVFRSKKSNRAQGFGFVKFLDKEVAAIAAKTMNGYWMEKKKIVCHVLSDQHPDPFKYKHGSKKLHFVNWSQKYVEDSNKDKSVEQMNKEVEKLLKNEQVRREQIKAMGISYTYNGYKEILGI